MSGAAPGTVVGLYLDTRDELHAGDLIRTGTGRTYELLKVRLQDRGAHAGRRWHVRALVLPPTFTPAPGDPVREIRWYPRRRARTT